MIDVVAYPGYTGEFIRYLVLPSVSYVQVFVPGIPFFARENTNLWLKKITNT